ncbi:MAG: urate hydroxylase PuuD [Gammaproteobacteria bacterium]|nr:urate hydroxylase PuuD [Gammaproteobacteria bacterium]
MSILSAAGFEFLMRWGHFLAGITWIGLLYYFNFVQGEYFKEATPDAKADAVKKLVPRVLWWFRWGAMFTFLTGTAILLRRGHPTNAWTFDITIGALLGTLMFLNVWLIIWPAQKIVCGIVQGDAAAAGPRALLASRTNTLFSGPMLMFMAASAHLPHGLLGSASRPALWLVVAIIAALQFNAMKGKVGPLASVKGVIHCSIALAVVLWLIMDLL